MNFIKIWDDYQWKYTDFKKQFIEISTPFISSICLTKLKKKYDNSIYSKRDTDNIKNLTDLLRILENRGILHYNNIEPLKYIASEVVQNSVLDRIIHEYEIFIKNLPNLPVFNIYKYRRNSNVAKPIKKPIENKISVKTNSVYHGPSHDIQSTINSEEAFMILNSEKQNIVFRRLSHDLDKYWRDLARFLDVTESEIDEIDRNIAFQTHDKALKVLEIFGKRSELWTWKSKLINALKIVRRRDLIEVIDELLYIS